MKNIIFKYKELLISEIIIVIIILIQICIIKNQNLEQIQQIPNTTIGIKVEKPDRIIFKNETGYYKINSYDKNYNAIINQVERNISEIPNYTIKSYKIDELKENNSFLEFDYDSISKNNIFFFSGDVSWIKMLDEDGNVAAKEINYADDLYRLVQNSVTEQNKVTFDNQLIKAYSNISYLPSSVDFETIKQNKVYKKEINSYTHYKNLIQKYKINFSQDINIEETIKNKKIILILSKYDIASYKVSVGNIKINFSGSELLVDDGSQNYKPMLIIVGTATNTKCIYYNYDQVNTKDNLTGNKEEIAGVVRKIDGNEIELSYTKSMWNPLGIVKIVDSTQIINDQNKTNVSVGDWVQVSGTVTGTTMANVKNYEAESINLTTEAEYNKRLEKILLGKYRINTIIQHSQESEGGGDGFIICELYNDEENNGKPYAYVLINYDENTESYLGRKESFLKSNYGIHENEIVDITFTETVKDVNKIMAKSFEFIAD